MSVTAPPRLTCREVVELATRYEEGELSPDDRERLEEHLVTCDPCVVYLDQMKETADAVGAAEHAHDDDGDGLAPGLEDALAAAFRARHGGG